MGNEIPAQLSQFLHSIALGGLLALFYDFVRALHPLGGRLWQTMLDSLVSFCAVASVFFFVMAGDGELRLFILFGAVGGAVLFFSLLSRPIRPVLSLMVNLLLLPVRLCGAFFCKLYLFFKNLFSFFQKWFTIMVTEKWPNRRRERMHGSQIIKTEDTTQQ